MNSELILGIFLFVLGCYGLLSWYSYKDKYIQNDELAVEKKWSYIPQKARKRKSLEGGIVFLILGSYLLIKELFFKKV
jgi:hypothetical protein